MGRIYVKLYTSSSTQQNPENVHQNVHRDALLVMKFQVILSPSLNFSVILVLCYSEHLHPLKREDCYEPIQKKRWLGFNFQNADVGLSVLDLVKEREDRVLIVMRSVSWWQRQASELKCNRLHTNCWFLRCDNCLTVIYYVNRIIKNLAGGCNINGTQRNVCGMNE